MYIVGMSRQAHTIELSPSELELLQHWARAGKTEQRLALRARIILAANEGDENKRIAADLSTTVTTVGKWRRRFHQFRKEGLSDNQRPGKAPIYDSKVERRILEMLDKPVPKGYSIWSGPLIAHELGDVSVHQVWRVLRKHQISLSRRHSWCISTDPEFEPKAAAVVGLYLDPPENVVVLSVDEKPAIQALERAQGWIRLPNGKALTGYNHEYKRHGTTTLFAALEIATGLVKAGHYQRRRRREFLDFMNDLVAAYPDKELYVVLDNLKTHKPKRDRWSQRHKNVHFIYTPTHASWLNQVEIWFSILWKKALRGASWTSPNQIRKKINDFVEVYNETAAPFEWKATEVMPVKPKNNYSLLRK
jgi:transposase